MLYGKKLYQGRSAELAAKSEIVVRGYNVADPEVEVGVDFLVMRHTPFAEWRVEVKSSRAIWHLRTGRWWCCFRIRWRQILDDTLPEIHYVFAARIAGRWEYIIISRSELLSHLPPDMAPLRPYYEVSLRFIFSDELTLGPGNIDYQAYRNHWLRYWPPHEDCG